MNEINKIIINYFRKLLKKHSVDFIGNNLNQFISSKAIDKLIQQLSKEINDPRKIRARMDSIRGELFERIVEFLLNEYFKNHKDYSHIIATRKGAKKKFDNENLNILLKKLNIARIGREQLKKDPDIDVIVFSKKMKDRLFLISIKGTARERIGQFLSNLFIFDKRVIKLKYGDKYLFEPPRFKIAFVCLDLAKNKDFSHEDKEKIEKKKNTSVKQLEVYLITDDNYVSGGIYVLNNLPKLERVGNFTELIGNIVKFFDEK
jgi:biotin operon repressor